MGTFGDPYAIAFLSGLTESVEEYEASVLLLRAAHDPDVQNRLLQRAAIDALVLVSPVHDDRSLDRLAQRGVRVIRTQQAASGDWVAIDDGLAGRLVGDHLARLGHTDVLVVAATDVPSEIEEFDHASAADHDLLRPGTYTGERLRGIVQAMPGARIRVISVGSRGRDGGRAAGARALDVSARPSAIIALSDVLAMGTCDAARTRGLTPGRDISVAGFDDVPEAAFLGLTTVRQPIVEKGRLAGRLALDPRYAPRRITLPIELVVRSSTGPAPH